MVTQNGRKPACHHRGALDEAETANLRPAFDRGIVLEGNQTFGQGRAQIAITAEGILVSRSDAHRKRDVAVTRPAPQPRFYQAPGGQHGRILDNPRRVEDQSIDLVVIAPGPTGNNVASVGMPHQYNREARILGPDAAQGPL